VTDRWRNAFEQLVVPPESLPREERVRCLRRLAGSLQAGRSREEVWLGTALADWLREGGDLERRLGVRPPRGSRTRVETLAQRGVRDGLLLQLATTVGSALRASRVLRGAEPTPEGAAELVQRLRAMRAPSSSRAFARARGATCHER